eukprot:CAMPEP_0198692650 /NCGR_PEP_ID=MMETSP1468-20131203/232424_1 /TAXON_ID=1461545 /ORGANISM="Mantoniella sp, Strain CCMP1436" /LENGTH=69 /DNA_ID=CAMNT_0044446717 /DNA_START=37 /DNA_END=242 /DNA_ORIENTATION=-
MVANGMRNPPIVVTCVGARAAALGVLGGAFLAAALDGLAAGFCTAAACGFFTASWRPLIPSSSSSSSSS